MVEQMVLQDISIYVKDMGREITNYELPALAASDEVSRDYYRELTEELNIGYEEEHLKMIETLNVEQRAGFNLIMNHVDKKVGQVRSMNLIAIATATSGITASIMPGGRTAHSHFKISIKLDNNTMYSFTKQSGTAAGLPW
uniref:ATP-dependent DNA helicase n=1 Tax=Saccharum spontaneum TaxID=62335 RepID=A0A678T698_SACSP|nr:hypothetical protein SS29K18_000003 [Saccharum spontaneum]